MPRALTIGIDARAAVEVPAGRGRVVRELVRELGGRDDGHHYRCYARRAWDEVDDPGIEWVLDDAADPWWHLRVARRLRDECDVFLSTNSYLTAALAITPTVPIVYDMIPFDRQLQPNRRSAWIERLTLWPAVLRSPAIIAISASTARDLGERYPRARRKVRVALLGAPRVPDLGPAPAPELPAPGFILAVGTLEPRKNLPRLVEAVQRLDGDRRRAHPLVVVGAQGWDTGPTLRALEKLGAGAHRLGYVSDATLAELYRRCAVFCFPSLGEGFGLPVLEAMAQGCAVLTSSVPALREVGGDAVAYANPRDSSAIARELERLLTDPSLRNRLETRALRRSMSFTWASFAEITVQTLTEAAAGAQRHQARTAS